MGALTDRDRNDLTDAIMADDRLGGDMATFRAVEHILAERLAEIATALPSLTEGAEREGTALWPERDRGFYSLAIEEAQAAIRGWSGDRT